VSNEINTCPFCGGHSDTFQHVGDDGPEPLYRVSCWNCAASSDWHRTPKKAIVAWNIRVPAAQTADTRTIRKINAVKGRK